MSEWDDDGIELDHFIYGSHEGYKVKAHSQGVDVDAVTDAFQGMFIPISQSDVKYLSEVRIILPFGEQYILLSHIIKGSVDEYQRKTQANHSVLIPRKLLANGDLTYEDVDEAMNGFEKDQWEAVGHIEKLSVDPKGLGPEVSMLKNYLSKKDLEKLINMYKKEKDSRVFLRYKGSDALQRVRTAFLLSMLVDVGLNVTKLGIFTDVPYPDAKKLFNLVISRSMISIKPGQGWEMLPVQAPPPESVITRSGRNPLDDIYG